MTRHAAQRTVLECEQQDIASPGGQAPMEPAHQENKQIVPTPARSAGVGTRRRFLFYALIYLASWLVYAVVAWPHTHPPYMDSFYYVDIARNLAHGQGLTEGFVWNYLGGAPPLRHPSSEYWLPGLSLLLAPVLALGGGYRAAALLTAAIAALCPALAAAIGRDLFGTRRHALTMAGLTLFNGLWFHDWTTPDAFVPFAALATLTLLLAGRGLRDPVAHKSTAENRAGTRYSPTAVGAVCRMHHPDLAVRGGDENTPPSSRPQSPWFAMRPSLTGLSVSAETDSPAQQSQAPVAARAAYPLAGLTAGLAALLRQEGVFLLVALLLAALLTPEARRRLWPGPMVGALALYALVQAPWLLHNVAVLGTPIASGGSRTLWMRSYDLFYILHAEQLTPRAYLAWGLSHIAAARLGAAMFMLAIWAAQWLVVLVPPLLVGLWRLRRRAECRPFLIYWALLAVVMPLLFTATLQNGTMQHASGALIPFGSAFVAAGLDGIGAALSRLRGADGARLARDMGIIAVGLAALVSVSMTMRTFPAHGDEYTHDAMVAAWLHRHNPKGAPVMVLDPPAFAYIDDGAYVVTPRDGMDAVLAVARRYGVAYWAVDPLYPLAQEPAYEPRHRPAWLRAAAVVDGVTLYRIAADRPRGGRRGARTQKE